MNDLRAYANDGNNYNPLICSIGEEKIITSHDTTEVFFRAFYKDSSNEITLKPLDLVGIMVINNKKYLPIYNHIEFDNFKNDSIGYALMKTQENLLKEKILQKKDSLNPWLNDEAKRRGVIK